MKTLKIPSIPFNPDPSLVAVIRAALEARKLNQLRRTVDAARKTA